MGFITFDWSQISYKGSPLMVPWWAQVHDFAGFVVMYWLVLPLLYYTNVGFPLSSATRSSPVCRCSDKCLLPDLAPRVYAHRWTQGVRPLRPHLQYHKNPRLHGPPGQPQQLRGIQRAVPPWSLHDRLPSRVCTVDRTARSRDSVPLTHDILWDQGRADRG